MPSTTEPSFCMVPNIGALITEALIRSIFPYLAALAILTIILWRLIGNLKYAGSKPPQPSKTAVIEDESGATIAEFILVAPLLLMLLLAIMQIALIVQAKFVVNYAAFCAVRSAIVTIPAKIRSQKNGRFEDANRLALNDTNSPKMNIIRRAAALPCAAVSPVYSAELGIKTATMPDLSIVLPLEKIALLFSASLDGASVSQQLVARGQYAFNKENTKVEIIAEEGAQASGQFGEHELVTVRVTHRYYLSVPFANRLLGKAFVGGGFWNGSAWYLPITEQYSLLNEGERLFPPDQDPGEKIVEVEIYD
jgi:hypothetical protein